jgi:hypothetical protein
VMVRTNKPKIQPLEAARTEADIHRFLRLAQQVDPKRRMSEREKR